MVLTNTSRAAKEAINPMPSFQSYPSGSITGSICFPSRRPQPENITQAEATHAKGSHLEE